MSLLIGLGYAAQMGKDTAAAHIIAERSDRFSIRRFAFADILKLEVFDALANRLAGFWQVSERIDKEFFYDSVLLPKPRNVFNTPDAEKLQWINENKIALRSLLQKYGTEYRRAGDPFYWVRALGLKINEAPPQVALITDMRFMNESYFIKANEGFTVKVHRNGFDNGVSDHVSEQALAKYQFDYEINVEEGDMQGLKADALEVFDAIIAEVTPEDMVTKDFTEEAFSAAA